MARYPKIESMGSIGSTILSILCRSRDGFVLISVTIHTREDMNQKGPLKVGSFVFVGGSSARSLPYYHHKE